MRTTWRSTRSSRTSPRRRMGASTRIPDVWRRARGRENVRFDGAACGVRKSVRECDRPHSLSVAAHQAVFRQAPAWRPGEHLTRFRRIQAVRTAGVPASRAPRAAACVAAALLLGLPAAASAHDPGLSALDVQVARDRIVAVLSLAAADVRIAADLSGGALDAFAAESIALTLDGTRLPGRIERQAADGEAGVRVTLAFNRASGSRLRIHSAVPERLARGHRELVTVHGTGGRALAERMLDGDLNAIVVDLRDEPAATSRAGQFFGLGLNHILAGYDHLLFLTALLLGLQRLSGVARTVTAF